MTPGRVRHSLSVVVMFNNHVGEHNDDYDIIRESQFSSNYKLPTLHITILTMKEGVNKIPDVGSLNFSVGRDILMNFWGTHSLSF